MSILAMKRVWATDIQPAGRKLVALKLADHCNDAGGSLFVGMAAIARDCGVSRSQAQRHVHALVDAGLLSVTANGTGGARGMVPHYRLHVERLAGLDTARGAGATRDTDATGSADATPGDIDTGSAGATGSADATGSTDAAHGSHGCGDGVAPMRRTGSTHATQTIINPVLTIKEPTVAQPAGALSNKARQSQLPDDFRPSEKGIASAAGLSLEVELEQFRNYHEAKGSLMLDWQAAWRTWCGNARKFARSAVSTARTPNASKHAGFEKLNYHEGINHDGSFA